MGKITDHIKQRLSLRKPLGQALEVVEKMADTLSFAKQARDADTAAFCKSELKKGREALPSSQSPLPPAVGRLSNFCHSVPFGPDKGGGRAVCALR